MTSFLQKIIEAKRLRVDAARARTELAAVKDAAVKRGREGGRFRDAVGDPSKINIIAEFKRASPSRGDIALEADPAQTALGYRAAGAAAISVLTEEDFFRGTLDDLRTVAETVSIPVLRKDFIIDEFQIFEAAAAGASAILLIAAVLDQMEIVRFQTLAAELGLDSLVEVHDAREMKIAADIGAGLIGVNNRNLSTFAVSLDVSRRLIEYAPADSVLVAESGISSAREIVELRELGYSAFLVGEALMRGGDLNELAGARE